jgi:8-oxo-dGTP diphosphatase
MAAIPEIRLAVDAIVFGYKSGELLVLLIKRRFGSTKGSWALPGGFVLKHEGLTTAVHRELKEETGITVSWMEQLYTFGDDVHRDPRSRVISVAYFALVCPSTLEPQANTDASDAQWFPLEHMPTLAFDHSVIVSTALSRLRAKLSYQPVGFELLDKEFPFSDLETLYSTILERPLDRRNFRKKFMTLGLLKSTGRIRRLGGGRPAQLFRFDRRKYEQLQRKGILLDLT